MIDTLRLKIPLTPLILRQIHESSRKLESWKLDEGTTSQKFYAPLVVSPHNRELMIIKDFDFLSARFRSKELYFTVEGSIPNLEFGENVSLFYPEYLPDVLNRIERALIEQYGDVPSWREWQVQRVDPVYAWKFKNKGDAKKALVFFQTLLYSQKNKMIYGDETVAFKGRSFSIQLYLKEIEFKKHGYKKLIKNEEREKADKALNLSQEVLRFEIRMFKQKLVSSIGKKVITCDDILDPAWYYQVLNETLTSMLKTSRRNTSSDREALVLLINTYKKEKAIRLFCFRKTYSLNDSIKKLINKHVASTTITRNMKDIYDAGVGIANPNKAIKEFDVSIPSESVVTPYIEPPIARAMEA